MSIQLEIKRRDSDKEEAAERVLKSAYKLPSSLCMIHKLSIYGGYFKEPRTKEEPEDWKCCIDISTSINASKPEFGVLEGLGKYLKLTTKTPGRLCLRVGSYVTVSRNSP